MNHIFTTIYAANVTVLQEEGWYKAAYQKVTAERRKKTDRLRFRKDRRLSLGAELLLLQGLKQLGLDPGEMSYAYRANGKPCLSSWQEVHFNLSHSEEMVLCVLSSQEVGCDIEKMADVSLDLAKRFFCPSEYERIAQQKTEALRREMFFRLWTLKESYIKMTGLGLGLPMNAFCIDIDTGGISVSQESDQKICYFQEFDGYQDYKCSICGLDQAIGMKNGVLFEILNFSDIL